MHSSAARASTWLILALGVACFAPTLSGCGDDGGGGGSDDGGVDGGADAEIPLGDCDARGLQGCPCSEGERCARSDNGDTLMCIDGLCEDATCISGGRGCACRLGSECDDSADACRDGFCQAADCEAGEEDCACLAGTCDPGLFCEDGTICRDSTGFEGGECLPNNTCERGNRCDPSLGICQHCDLGSSGCACTDLDTCNQGLACVAGHCIDSSLVPPEDPVCYTPCRNHTTGGDGERQCDSDGLLDGCLDDQECVDGSCVPPGGEKPKCDSDLDCPFFQACLSGGCYSNCVADVDCSPGLGCYKKVCRVPCSGLGNASVCPSGYGCDAADGENGYCVQNGDPGEDKQMAPSGGFTLSEESIDFTNIKTSGQFRIYADDSLNQEFTIHKLWHEVTGADGKTERVDAKRDPDTGEWEECDAAKGECPLFWLKLAVNGEAATAAEEVTVKAPPSCEDEECPTIKLSGAGSGPGVRWQAALLVSSRNGDVPVLLSYTERPEGRWSGTMYYFGTFEDGGLPAWLVRSDKSNINGVVNGLIQRWGAFRKGNLDSWEEFLAVLTATRTESWTFPNVKERCEGVTGGSEVAACYPYVNTAGVKVYVQDTESAPIPTGVTEFPIAFNLKLDDETKLVGRIASDPSLHYPADPAVSFDLEADPSKVDGCNPDIDSDCVVYLTDFDATVNVGGRYYSKNADCEPGYAAHKLPWLVAGFTQGTVFDDGTGDRFRYECRDMEVPYDLGVDTRFAPLNESLAGANPVPDGRARERKLELLDGALINQTQLFVMFRETFPTFIPGEPPVSAYGYMILQRNPTDLKEEDFVGVAPPDATMKTGFTLGVECSPELLEAIQPGCTSDVLTTSAACSVPTIVDVLLNGTQTTAGYADLSAGQIASDIHYLCVDTGQLDGGAGDAGVNPVRNECPNWSEVKYFDSSGFLNQADIANQPCQEDLDDNGRAKCGAVLQSWIDSGLVEPNPIWKCSGTNTVFCDDDRQNLRTGKKFFRPTGTPPEVEFLPLIPEIQNAFRYKIRFRSDTGGQIGFAPQICIPGSDQIPYCYDPAGIEQIKDRVDCLVDIYTQFPDTMASPSTLPAPTKTALYGFLRSSFSSFECVPGSKAGCPCLGNNTCNGGLACDVTGVCKEAASTVTPRSPEHEGFERLYAELLIMLGDEALTAAFASRFDLAGTGGAAFIGSAFEPGGIDLTGIAGFEMVKLYGAVQYYQLALDRMYLLGPNFEQALANGPTGDDRNFVSPETVTAYLERLIRAATQKARAWSEIAKRYQSFNQPELARSVIERAYAATYLESALISKLMLDIDARSANSYRPQIRFEIENAQRRYRMALLDMRDVYSNILDSVTIFGFAPDYIPFPALDSSNFRENNGYEVLAGIARMKVDLAKQREQVALESNRTQKTDAAQFQSELVRVRNTYENQLSEICGTMTGLDGRVYPAISKYAYLNEKASLLGDPCGRMGNGKLHEAMANVQITQTALRTVLLHANNVASEMEIETDRAAGQCDITNQVAGLQKNLNEFVADRHESIGKTRAIMGSITREIEAIMGGMSLMDCESFGCPLSAALAATAIAIQTAANVSLTVKEFEIVAKEREIADEQAKVAEQITKLEGCSRVMVDSAAAIQRLQLSLGESELEALRTDYQMRLALSEVLELANAAQRWQAQQREAEQMLINVESARNDPNVRIYRNDAVINADIAFDDAVRDVYRTTRVFEYYTSQSYAKRDQLFLIRMVTAGEYNLENYLNELQNEFFTFEEEFGVPDTRVQILSLRDDLLQIPYLDDDGAPLSQGKRIQKMRDRLKDVALLDSNGYLTIPFGTQLEVLSPLTRNHKIHHVEADIVGSDVGDTLGRVYLRQMGTGIIRSVNDTTDYYVFPERTGVINTYFNGNRVFDPELYRNYRLRDRALANTLWELVINQRDEEVNKDIDLQSLSDIRLLVYYNDFTAY